MFARTSFNLFKLFLAALGFVFLAFLLLYLTLLPHILYLRESPPGATSLMRYRGGPIHQTWVPLHRISPHLHEAVLKGEDIGFYAHSGFDFAELKASFQKNLREKRWARGGSTITMQLAKNLYLTPRKTPLRKVLEAVITFELEQYLPKKRILEIYLNVIEWGPSIYGAEEAAHHYFKKPAAQLSPPEAATLAALIPNPRLFNQKRYQRYVERRKNWILARMHFLEPEPEREPLPPPESDEELTLEELHSIPVDEEEPQPLPIEPISP